MKLLSAVEAKSAVQKEEEILERRVGDLKKEMGLEVQRLNDLKDGIEQAKTRLNDEVAQVRAQAETEKEIILGEIRVLEAKRSAITESIEEKKWLERHHAVETKEIEVNARFSSLLKQEEALKERSSELDIDAARLNTRNEELDEKARTISLQSQANQIILDSLERQAEETRKETTKLEQYRASIRGTFDEAKHDLLTNSAYKK